MQKPLTALLLAGLIVAGCGWRDSRLNPGNWFGKSHTQPVEMTNAEPTNPLVPKKTQNIFAKKKAEDLSLPIMTVTKLEVEPTNTGAIIFVEGVAARQGPYDVELRDISTPEEKADGVLSLSFRVTYPNKTTLQGNEFARTVRAAKTLTKGKLAPIRTIRVVGETNAQVTTRRR
ncbi:hypothetical protein [Pseudodonghicola xiamenensis]|uniref:Lipoprotein n=1 Tax=Pseudodonghicola xiamenensis TaxID=337702 RepID=A0A8J3HA19_9RHOB|nr:hypothetical protein [Pseudodonghicola xiamenensis]GHG95178.1 hypothetical protein GCM10010961_28690 [Pseudodonghicola xiamenensis]